MDRNEFIRKQIEYNTRREREHYKHLIKNDEAYKQELIKLYNSTSKSITETIESLYTRYGLSEGITIEQARKRVSKMDVEAFREKANDFLNGKNVSKHAQEQMKLYNLKQKISALELMKLEIALETIKQANTEEAMLYEHLTKAFEQELERQAGYHKISKPIRQKIVKDVDQLINGSHKSVHFSDRIWTNQAELRNRLQEGLQRSLLLGENPKVWSRKFREHVKKNMGDTGKENALYMANRLAITEDSRMLNATQLLSFKNMDFNAYIWICEPNACHVCAPYHGEVFRIGKNMHGEDLPPMHPHCRCSIAAYYEYNPDEDWSLLDFI